MKKIVLLLLVGLLLSSSAYAVSFDYLSDNNYVETQSDFFTLTDFTTANSSFTLVFEQASYESTFGLYTVDDFNNPTALLTSLEVFDLTSEPGTAGEQTERSVNFKTSSTSASGWQAAVVSNGAIGTFTDFDTTFGFYFGVDSDHDNSINYTFYTAEMFNVDSDGVSTDANIEHIRTFYREVDDKLYVLLDDQLGPYSDDITTGGRDNDWTDMQVFANDIAPVPEPATLLLLGSGLVGLAFLKRRKS